ncbi:MAG: SDR family oxidoreductase [Anaerolineales bacterium]|nr:SDR family oxidoreductase [Anaerolineales bacterium]
MKKPTFFENVVVITGASSGIGRALAYLFAEQGAWLSLAARNEERLMLVAHECEERGGKALVVRTDVSDSDQCKRLIDNTIATYGRIDTLINNAGLTMWSYFEDITDLSIMERIMRVNFFGSMYTTYYALPTLKETKGRLVAISSMTGKAGVPTRSGYAASKHAMVGFFDTLRIELAKDGVSVTIIYPDFVATEIRQHAFDGSGKPMGKSPVHEDKVMSAETCARLSLKAITNRKREDIQSTRGVIGQWLKLIAPGLVDRIALNAIEKGR